MFGTQDLRGMVSGFGSRKDSGLGVSFFRVRGILQQAPARRVEFGLPNSSFGFRVSGFPKPGSSPGSSHRYLRETVQINDSGTHCDSTLGQGLQTITENPKKKGTGDCSSIYVLINCFWVTKITTQVDHARNSRAFV